MNTTDRVRVREVAIEKVAISVEEASNLLGIAKPTLYKTIKDIHGVLHDALETAVELEMINRNVADKIKLPTVIKPEIKPLDEEEVKAFIAEIQNNKYKNLYFVALFTGMREGEVCGLTWDEIDFKAGTITIRQQIQRIKGEYTLVTTKASKTRIICPANDVMEVLKEIRKNQLQSESNWNNKFNLVFTNESGKNVCPHVVYLNFKRIAEKIGCPDARFHDLRHTYATLSISNGDNIKEVQEALGHYSSAFTADVYGHVTKIMQKESAERMNKFIKAIAAS